MPHLPEIVASAIRHSVGLFLQWVLSLKRKAAGWQGFDLGFLLYLNGKEFTLQDQNLNSSPNSLTVGLVISLEDSILAFFFFNRVDNWWSVVSNMKVRKMGNWSTCSSSSHPPSSFCSCQSWVLSFFVILLGIDCCASFRLQLYKIGNIHACTFPSHFPCVPSKHPQLQDSSCSLLFQL